MAITQTISNLSPVPIRGSASFSPDLEAFHTDLSGMPAEINAWAAQVNALAGALNALATGGALSIDLTAKSATGDADPGAGGLRWNNFAAQNAATVLRVSTSDDDGADWASLLDLFDDSTSTVKGYVIIRSKTDPSKFLAYTLSAVASASGYRNLTVANVAYSAAAPFADGDDIVLQFTPKGDKGDTGATGATGAAGTNGTNGQDGGIGKMAIPIPAGAMTPSTTSGAGGPTKAETSTNKVMQVTLDFDAASTESAQFAIPWPKSANEGTITFEADWLHGATTTNFGVAWELAAVGCGDGDAGDVAFGTAVIQTDTGGTTGTIYRTDESSALTISNLAEKDLVFLRIRRKHDDAGDTMAVDAKLLALRLYLTTNASNDA